MPSLQGESGCGTLERVRRQCRSGVVGGGWAVRPERSAGAMTGGACKPGKAFGFYCGCIMKDSWCTRVAEEGHDLIHMLQRLPLMPWEESTVGRLEGKPGDQ